MDDIVYSFENIDPRLRFSNASKNVQVAAYHAAEEMDLQSSDRTESQEVSYWKSTSFDCATQDLEYLESAHCSTRSFEYPDPDECTEKLVATPYFAPRNHPWPSSSLVCNFVDTLSCSDSDDQSSEDDLDDFSCNEGKKRPSQVV
jgi:hypothetical protein